VEAVSGIRAGSGKYLGSVHNLTAVEPNMNAVVRLDWKEGSNAVPAQLGNDGAFVDDDYAKKHHLHVGSPASLTQTGLVLDPLKHTTTTNADPTVFGILSPASGASDVRGRGWCSRHVRTANLRLGRAGA
jgi:hypothetical protein